MQIMLMEIYGLKKEGPVKSLPEERNEEWPALKTIVTAGGFAIGFVICSVVFAKVGYTLVALILRGATHAVQVSGIVL
ncbi:MAG TPA: hypothetical protein VK440_05710 [Burkholderiales bacterium]|nr:hypothetical protein [Burkholderiales bacterium]